jgi:nicotinamidase/pyrazinamidase
MTAPGDRLRPGSALLLVDVQMDFCPGGALPVAEGDRIVPVLNRWLVLARERGVPVYASRDWHPHGHLSFREQGGPWPTHCVQGSEGAAYHPDLELPDDVVQVVKGVRFDRDQLSLFQDTGFAERLRRDGVTTLWVGGFCQDICVRATVLDALGAGFEVHLIEDGTRPADPEAADRSLREMRECGAVIESSR